MAPKLHEQARKLIAGAMCRALDACVLDKGWPITAAWFEAFDSAAKLVVKHRGEWVSWFDVYVIVATSIRSALIVGRQPEELSGPLKSLIEKARRIEIADAITLFIESLPRPYRILFPLPQVAITRRVNLTNDVWFESPDTQQDQVALRSLLGGVQVKRKPDRAYISLAVSGYAESSLEQSAFREAAAALKRLLYLGILYKVFIPATNIRLLTLGTIFGESMQHIGSALAYDQGRDPHAPTRADLTLGLSHALEGLAIGQPTGISATSPTEVLEHGIARDLAPAYTLLTTRQPSIDTSAISSALEWAFEAYAEKLEDQSTAFIKTWIAVEALLGDEKDSESTSRQLADRCAYLLGRSRSQRTEIRNAVKELYETRSKLVHGRTTYLSDKESQQLEQSRTLLDSTLRREIANLRAS